MWMPVRMLMLERSREQRLRIKTDTMQLQAKNLHPMLHIITQTVDHRLSLISDNIVVTAELAVWTAIQRGIQVWIAIAIQRGILLAGEAVRHWNSQAESTGIYWHQLHSIAGLSLIKAWLDLLLLLPMMMMMMITMKSWVHLMHLLKLLRCLKDKGRMYQRLLTGIAETHQAMKKELCLVSYRAILWWKKSPCFSHYWFINYTVSNFARSSI